MGSREREVPEVLICEVGPRDGLQNDAVVLGPAVRAELCRRLADTGVGRVEAVSFVHPRLVPAMAGAEEVLAELGPGPWAGLILNERGFDRAVAAAVPQINLTVAVTETFCQRNQGCSRHEAEQRLATIATRAREVDAALTVTLAVSFGCPFEGRVPARETLALAELAVAAGVTEVVLADTIGVATPTAVGHLIGAVAGLGVTVGGHFHDTRNTGIANCLAALDAGATVLDASVGGIGGCPFAPGATGNVATEDLLYTLSEEGVETGVDPAAMIATAEWLGGVLGRDLPSALTRAGWFGEVPAPTGAASN